MKKYILSILLSVTIVFSITDLLYAQESGAVRLLSHYIAPSGGSYTSGCWGWTDSTTGREYALLGNECGTAVVEITDPLFPVERDFVPAVCSSWRELQVYSHYAYVVSEGGGGTQIIDLSYLPDSVHLVRSFTYTQSAKNTSRAHTIVIEGSYMYLNGCAFWSPGGILVFSLADPVNPVFRSEYARNYIHDCFVHNDTIYGAAINGQGVDIIDVRVKTNPVYLTTITYSGSGTHNCATTENGQFLLTTDEVGSTPKTLKVWDLRSPPTYTKVAEYVGDPVSIVHNVFVKGDLAFMSYYTAGLKVVDISDPTHPNEIGGYDTYQGPSGGYTGAWSTYPFFPSGRVIIGDMVSGLYIVDLDTNAPRTPASFSAYSDYTTPTSVQLTWTDPTTLVSGDTLQNFHIRVYRNGSLVAVVDSGVQNYTDGGRTTHQQYSYSILAAIPGDSSGAAVSAVYAGGAAQPRAATNFAVLDATDGIRLSWRNPSAQIDGTPLNDLAFVNIYRDGVLYDSVAQTFADTAQIRTFQDFVTGYHRYRIRIRDNETPTYYSAFSDSLLGFGGLTFSYSQDFESGRGESYVKGTWDTTRTIAYGGSASLTDSPQGNYPNNSNTYFLTPPVIVGTNMALTFHHIAIITSGDYGFVEISRNHNATYSTLGVYNANLHPQWQDGHADPGDWFTQNISLNTYAGDTIAIRFRLQANSTVNADGWYVDDINIGPATGVDDPNNQIPATFILKQNFPNPFNPTTTIAYALPIASTVNLRIFNILGEEITTLVDAEQPAGWNNIVWNGTNSNNARVSSGLYFYRLTAAGFDATHFLQQRKMLLLK